jgi:ATP-dependent DNA helicase RecG
MKKNGSPEPIFETGDDYSYFITTLPVHPAFLKGEGVNEGVNEAIYDIINILFSVSGLNAIELASRTERGLSTIERHLRLLRKKEIIEFRGATKTGGYHLTDKAKEKLQ